MRKFLCVVLLLVLSLPLSSVHSQSSMRIVLTQEDYERLLSLVIELSQLNESLHLNIEGSKKSIELLEIEISRMSNDLSSLRDSYQKSIVAQESSESRSLRVEALLQQAENSLQSLTKYYEEQLLKSRAEKKLLKWTLGSLNVAQASVILVLVLQIFFF